MKIFLIIKDPNMIKAQERSKDSVKIILTMSLLCFWAFISWGGSESSRNYQTYLHLCSEDEQMSYGFGTTWGWIINESIFIFGWTIPLTDKVMEKCGAKKVIKSRHIIRLKPEIMLDDSGWCVCCDTFSQLLLNQCVHDESSGVRHVRRMFHPGRGLGGPRARRTNMHFTSSSTGGLSSSQSSSYSPSNREAMDPIAGV